VVYVFLKEESTGRSRLYREIILGGYLLRETHTAKDPVLKPSEVSVIPISRSKDFQKALLPGLVGAVASASIFVMTTN
jgi:hypothetical protein